MYLAYNLCLLGGVVMKTIVKICLVALSAFLLLFAGKNVFADSNSHDNLNSLEVSDRSFRNGELLKSYLVKDKDRIYFDYDKAVQDKQAKDVIDMGLLVETISEDYSSNTFTPAKYFKAGLPVYGNYCGPGYNGEGFTLPVVDVLDQGCQNHDRCYKWGAGIGANCECNRQLVDFIKVNRRWIPESALWVADAIRVYFETIGAIGC